MSTEVSEEVVVPSERSAISWGAHPALAMVAAALLWSSGGIFIKTITLDAVSLAAWRSGIAAVVLLLIAKLWGIRVGVPRDPVAWASIAIYSLIMILFVQATKLTTAANAIFLQYTAPMYVLLLEPVLLKTRFRARDLGFVLAAFAGMSLFFVGKIEAGGMKGNLLALGSGVCLAAFFLMLRARQGDQAARWQGVVWGNAALFVGVAVYDFFTTADLGIPSAPREIGGLLFLGIVQIGVAYALFAYAISKISALEATLIGMLEPMLNPVWVFLGTGERPSLWALVGAALIVGSIGARAVIEQRNSRRDPAAQAR